MRKAFGIVLCILFCLISLESQGQRQLYKISVHERGVTIKDTTFSFPVSSEFLVELLGKPNRIVKGVVNDVFVWDRLGIIGYQMIEQSKIHTLAVEFGDTEVKYSPKKNFRGELWLNGKTISAQTLGEDLKKQRFFLDRFDNTCWEFNIGSTRLFAVLKEDYSGLLELEIGPK